MLARLVDFLQTIKPGNQWSHYLIEEALAAMVLCAVEDPEDPKKTLPMLDEVEPACKHLLLLIVERDWGYEPNLLPKRALDAIEKVALADEAKRDEIMAALETRLQIERKKVPKSDGTKYLHERLISHLKATLTYVSGLT